MNLNLTSVFDQERDDPQPPTTLVLMITTHGSTHVVTETGVGDQLLHLKVPENLEVIRVFGNSIGEPNFLSPTDTEIYTGIIRDHMGSLMTEPDVQPTLERIVDAMEMHNDNHVRRFRNLLTQEMIENATLNQDKSLTITTKHPGEDILFKMFKRDQVDDDGSMICDMNDNIDLLNLMSTVDNMGAKTMSIVDIFRYCQSKWVGRLIMFDFSCNDFRTLHGQKLSHRHTRQMPALAGKKRKKAQYALGGKSRRSRRSRPKRTTRTTHN